MKNPLVKALLIAASIPAIPLQAQTTPITGNLTASGSILSKSTSAQTQVAIRPDGTISAKGISEMWGGSLLPEDELGSGAQFLWCPSLGALRVGTFDHSDEYSAGNSMGLNSIAMGENPVASGFHAIALGTSARALGYDSVAIGKNSYSLGDYTIAIGYSTFSQGDLGSVAIGFGAYAAGALGSVALGYNTAATGFSATAAGRFSSATAIGSTALGYQTHAESLASTAIGANNIGGGSTYEWIGTDPLFEIGNGQPPEYADPYQLSVDVRSNAMTVYKNGNVDIQGVITCAPGGDIPMFTGN